MYLVLFLLFPSLRPVFLFIYIQQFITWRVVEDRGNDYVATYMQSKLTSKYKRKDEGKREGKNQKNSKETEINYRN